MEKTRIRRGVVGLLTLGLGILTIVKAPHLLMVGIAGWQIGSWSGDLGRWINSKLDAKKRDEV